MYLFLTLLESKCFKEFYYNIVYYILLICYNVLSKNDFKYFGSLEVFISRWCARLLILRWAG